ncbi:MAG TPA: 1-(5-phosphoribosyl)-5-[(5-phosphoribosylamino)methylideneamino]imidazole-4-carboxamide isomerase [Candidatus Saccharimonadales bacterium]|nr:1-(5-phosphoribosyl)-5-[(5-phosphoribosylamino)methylideneamino]imidazole-4-carboxamide isomerase [Candidatus Saccharimonadales bacterium]
MQIIPAIDIRQGKCVRLIQGDFEREKIYSDDPIEIARKWKQQGARLIHLVDLDGAKSGNLENLITIKKILNEINVPIQVGGGIRNKKTINSLISIGVSRVILGTIALEDENELKNIINDFAQQIAVALDTKNGLLMKNGWLRQSNKNLIATALQLESLGVQRFIYTDIVSDGMLTQPNYKEIENLVKQTSSPVIAGGGISDLLSLEKLKSIGVEGVIIGKALYEGKIDLREAINAY